MSVVAAALRELMALGVTGEALVSAVERIEEAAVNERAETLEQAVAFASRKEDEKLAARKSRAAERTRRWREAKEMRTSVTVTPGDVTAHHGDASDDHLAPPCAQVVDPTSSLRSEDIIPPQKPSVSSPRKAKSTVRPSRRCPADWAPCPETQAKLLAEGHSVGDLERALTRMRDHEFRTARSDWAATFRNWVRTDADRKPPQAHERPHTDAKFAARQANLDRALAGADSAAGRRWEP